jgi:hypothetical protein
VSANVCQRIQIHGRQRGHFSAGLLRCHCGIGIEALGVLDGKLAEGSHGEFTPVLNRVRLSLAGQKKNFGRFSFVGAFGWSIVNLS